MGEVRGAALVGPRPKFRLAKDGKATSDPQTRLIDHFDGGSVSVAVVWVVNSSDPLVVAGVALHPKDDGNTEHRTAALFGVGIKFVGLRFAGRGIERLR